MAQRSQFGFSVTPSRIGFELWTGVEPHVGAMREALRPAFGVQ